jgi:hypothetical protein
MAEPPRKRPAVSWPPTEAAYQMGAVQRETIRAIQAATTRAPSTRVIRPEVIISMPYAALLQQKLLCRLEPKQAA